MRPDDLPDFIERIIRDHIREGLNDDFHEYKVGVYYPHMIGYCPLRYYYVYRFSGSVDLTDEELSVTTAGRMVHDFIQLPLRNLGYEIEREVEYRVSDDIVIRGKVDAYWPGGEIDGVVVPPHVVEIKTVDRLPSRPYGKHIQQLNLYLGILGVQHGVFVYITRSRFQRRYFVISYDPPLFEESIEWVRRLHESLIRVSPPDPKPVAEWECRGCPVRDICPLYTNTRIDVWFT